MHSSLIGVASLAIWTYLIAFRGGFWRLPYRPAPTSAVPARSVVAIVPARDEAAVIGQSIASLLAQDHLGCLHIILVDDESSDGTAEIARATAAAQHAGNRLTIYAGKPLPRGWTGKLWALHQGIAAARPLAPDYLLLTDADVVHDRINLRNLIARSESGGYDLVSLMVKLHCDNIWERLLIPAFVFFFFKLYPPRWVADPARRTSAAAGGCMLIRPAVIERMGGISRIRHEIIDDCALARMVKPVGGVWLGFSSEAHSIREYRSWRPIWNMITRTAFAQLGYSAASLAATLALLALTYMAPPLLLLSADPAAVVLGSAVWLAMSAAFVPLLRAHRSPPVLAFLLPLIALFYTAATVASAVLFWRGRGGQWKGRFQAQPASTPVRAR